MSEKGVHYYCLMTCYLLVGAVWTMVVIGLGGREIAVLSRARICARSEPSSAFVPSEAELWEVDGTRRLLCLLQVALLTTCELETMSRLE